ncbi:esterase family protein [Brevibacillus laterosporus]|nr:alpha/beta hydrolase-fold protein [Brevibacillus laterosporus]TPG69405.1 esterase family protein [Brevibacillus laterosporus]
MSSPQTPKGSLSEVTLSSQHLGTTETLLIYTPPFYSPLYSYPVLYAQDGRDYLSLGRLPGMLDSMLDKREIQNLIVVFIPVELEKRRSRYHPDGEEFDAYIRFMAEEIVPYMDKNYATEPLSGGRTLIGDSLGGTVSLATAIRYPHTFGNVASQSGALYDSFYTLAENSHSLEQLSLYLEIGTKETAVSTSRGIIDLFTPHQRFVELLQQKKATFHLELSEGDHTWEHWQAHLPQIIRYFYS